MEIHPKIVSSKKGDGGGGEIKDFAVQVKLIMFPHFVYRTLKRTNILKLQGTVVKSTKPVNDEVKFASLSKKGKKTVK